MGCGGSKSEEPGPAPKPTKPRTPPPPVKPAEPPAEYGTYTPFTEFPTPQLLAQAQLDYKAANVFHPTGDDGIPLPFPPTTSRAEAFDAEKCKAIDKHARNAPPDIGASDYETLVEYLVRPAENDVEKVRAFFVWIANQGLQRVQKYVEQHGTPPRHSPLFTLYVIVVQRRAGSYANLLANMCRTAGIPCLIADGVTVKGVSYRVGDENISSGNSHCLVYVDGSWRLIDQHWGSQGVIAQIDDDWDLIAGRQRTGVARNQYATVVYHCNDFWFLTDPQRFVYSHLPQQKDYQLLARPVGADENVELAYLEGEFFDAGLKVMNQPRCVIRTDTGSVVFQIGMPDDDGNGKNGDANSCELDYSLYKSKYNREHNSVEGRPIEQYVLVEYIRGRTVCQITVNVPKYGRHKLVVLAANTSGSYLSNFVDVCQYLILSESLHYFEPFPSHAQRRRHAYGLTPEAAAAGFFPEHDESAIVEASDGKVELIFVTSSTTTTTTQFTHRLVRHDDQGHEEEMRSFVRHYRKTAETADDNKQIVVVVLLRLPKFGQYVYDIGYQTSAATTASSRLLSTYLVRSDVGCDDATPFPEANDAEIGAIGSGVVVAVSHQKAAFEYRETKELRIEMRALRVDRRLLSADLRRNVDGGGEDASRYVLLETSAAAGSSQSLLRIFAKFPRHGTYKLNILAENDVVYQYVIFVYCVTTDALPFPEQKSAWKSDFVIHEPRCRRLVVNSSVTFSLEITGVEGGGGGQAAVESVEVVTSGTGVAVPLRGNGSTWSGEVDLMEEGELSVRATVRDQPDYQNLLGYTVVSEAAMRADRRNMDEWAEDAEKMWKKMQRRKAAERANAKKRRQKKDEKSKKLEKYFKANRTKLEEIDKNIEEEDRRHEEKQNGKQGFSVEPADENVSDNELELTKNVEIEEANNRVPEWQLHFERLQPGLTTEKLRLAAASKDIERLSAAIEEARIMNIDEKEIVKAQHLLNLLRADRDLKEACEDGDVDEIERIIGDIEGDERLEAELRSAVRRAQAALRALHKRRPLANVMATRDAFAEVRAMQQVQPPVHRFVQAFLLLYGEDEESTKEWRSCQAMFSTTGRGCLQRRVHRFDPDKVNEEIAARSVELMDETGINLRDASRMGSGIQTLFMLMKGQVDKVRTNTKNATPADVNRQREIFNRPPLEPEKGTKKHIDIRSLDI